MQRSEASLTFSGAICIDMAKVSKSTPIQVSGGAGRGAFVLGSYKSQLSHDVQDVLVMELREEGLCGSPRVIHVGVSGSIYARGLLCVTASVVLWQADAPCLRPKGMAVSI